MIGCHVRPYLAQNVLPLYNRLLLPSSPNDCLVAIHTGAQDLILRQYIRYELTGTLVDVVLGKGFLDAFNTGIYILQSLLEEIIIHIRERRVCCRSHIEHTPFQASSQVGVEAWNRDGMPGWGAKLGYKTGLRGWRLGCECMTGEEKAMCLIYLQVSLHFPSYGLLKPVARESGITTVKPMFYGQHSITFTHCVAAKGLTFFLDTRVSSAAKRLATSHLFVVFQVENECRLNISRLP